VDGLAATIVVAPKPAPDGSRRSEHMFAIRRESRYRGDMTDTADFSPAVVGHVCDGPAALRAGLVERGLDITTIARLVRCSPLTLARSTKTGASPRGVLVGLATLVTVLDRLEARGVDIGVLARSDGPDARIALAIDSVAGESPLAARMIDRLRKSSGAERTAAQLTFDALHPRAA
jgi:hypothetical protein